MPIYCFRCPDGHAREVFTHKHERENQTCDCGKEMYNDFAAEHSVGTKSHTWGDAMSNPNTNFATNITQAEVEMYKRGEKVGHWVPKILKNEKFRKRINRSLREPKRRSRNIYPTKIVNE